MGKKQCAASRPGEGGPPAGQPSPAPCPPTVSTAKPGLTFAMPEPVYVTLGRDDVDLQLRHSRFDACLALGLDVEARPSYYRGQQNHRVDTIQICSESACVVVSLAEASVLPPLLGRLVSCPGILKFGCGVVDDLQLLARRFPATFRPKDATRGAFVGSCVELGVLAPLTGAVDAAAQPYGLRRLAAHFGVELHKPKRIQMSDWSRVPLSEAQIRYAASDAAVSRWLASMLLRTSQCSLLAAAALPYAGLGGGGGCIASVLRAGVDFGRLPLGARRILQAAEVQRNQAKLEKTARKKLKRPRDGQEGQVAAVTTVAAMNRQSFSATLGHSSSADLGSCSRSPNTVGLGLSGGGAPPAKRPRQVELNGGGIPPSMRNVAGAVVSTPMVGVRPRGRGKAGRGREKVQGLGRVQTKKLRSKPPRRKQKLD